MQVDGFERLISIALRWKTGKPEHQALFEEADPPAIDRADFENSVATRLRDDAVLRDAWQTYSYDKRGGPSPYLDGLEVGFFQGHSRDVRRHNDAADACADFLYRETQWVLYRRATNSE